MYFIFFLVWMIFNGIVTTETVVMGLAVAAGMYIFICKFMNYSISTDIAFFKRFLLILHYLGVLVKEIVKANFAVIKLITSSKYEPEPVLISFKTKLKSKPARIMLANSITLTPGTITVSLKADELIVHCLDKDLAEGIDSSIFVKLLERMERI